MTDLKWVPIVRVAKCHHNWVTNNVEEKTTGVRVISQTCPHCGKIRISRRRILPKLHRPKQNKCKHIWLGLSIDENEEKTLRRYVHECPKCGYRKQTIRRILVDKLNYVARDQQTH